MSGCFRTLCLAFAVLFLLVMSASGLWARTADEQRLLDAARGGSGVQSLLEKGVSPKARDAQGRTPLHFAAANGH